MEKDKPKIVVESGPVEQVTDSIRVGVDSFKDSLLEIIRVKKEERVNLMAQALRLSYGIIQSQNQLIEVTRSLASTEGDLVRSIDTVNKIGAIT